MSAVFAGEASRAASASGILLDDSPGDDWAGYGRTHGEQHFSPLDEIDPRTVGGLGLDWSHELGLGNSATAPIAVAGVIYFASGYSVVHAIDALTGKLLWQYDPKVIEVAGDKLRVGWGSRGIGYWNGKVYTATHDGRLIAIDVKTGKPVWTAKTTGDGDGRYITGAPRLFDGKVIIGHGGADYGYVRGYVTAYDAETGKQAWRFYTVPGNPADGFENDAMKMAAGTWHGEWWKFGGGGTVWNAMAYDAGTRTVFLGTGNGTPWNHRIRSAGKGDNLFLCSIVALDADTGAYKWHYQINPGETWDYNAAMDLELADLAIDGKPRKVIMTAPKNGFYYVIDRITGQFISAEPYVKVNWASRIDPETGRPVENPAARYPDGTSFTLYPGALGGHNWPAMAFSPKTGLAYFPTHVMPATFTDKGIDQLRWQRRGGQDLDNSVAFVTDEEVMKDPTVGTSALIAWDPVRQKEVWRVPTPSLWNGGVFATAGGLVFQGHIDGTFNAYSAQTGEKLWEFKADGPITVAPITYRVKGRQYVTVLTGLAGIGAIYGVANQQDPIAARSMRKRVLTFALGGKATLPAKEKVVLVPIEDPDFQPNPALADRGATLFTQHCGACHGFGAISGGFAPDLRVSPVIPSAETFAQVVRGGALLARGMPRFHEFTDDELAALRQYLRTEASLQRKSTGH